MQLPSTPVLALGAGTFLTLFLLIGGLIDFAAKGHNAQFQYFSGCTREVWWVLDNSTRVLGSQETDLYCKQRLEDLAITRISPQEFHSDTSWSVVWFVLAGLSAGVVCSQAYRTYVE